MNHEDILREARGLEVPEEQATEVVHHLDKVVVTRPKPESLWTLSITPRWQLGLPAEEE